MHKKQFNECCQGIVRTVECGKNTVGANSHSPESEQKNQTEDKNFPLRRGGTAGDGVI